VGRPSIVDVVRSMFALGYSREEIYEVLSLAGLEWENAQLLIERVGCEAEILATREDRLRRAVGEVVGSARSEILERLSALEMRMDLLVRLLRTGRAQGRKR
jgi:hypothetical protein